jgi:hypothetical protein
LVERPQTPPRPNHGTLAFFKRAPTVTVDAESSLATLASAAGIDTSIPPPPPPRLLRINTASPCHCHSPSSLLLPRPRIASLPDRERGAESWER